MNPLSFGDTAGPSDACDIKSPDREAGMATGLGKVKDALVSGVMDESMGGYLEENSPTSVFSCIDLLDVVSAENLDKLFLVPSTENVNGSDDLQESMNVNHEDYWADEELTPPTPICMEVQRMKQEEGLLETNEPWRKPVLTAVGSTRFNQGARSGVSDQESRTPSSILPDNCPQDSISELSISSFGQDGILLPSAALESLDEHSRRAFPTTSKKKKTNTNNKDGSSSDKSAKKVEVKVKKPSKKRLKSPVVTSSRCFDAMDLLGQSSCLPEAEATCLPLEDESTSDDDDDQVPIRKCIVCLNRRRCTVEIYEPIGKNSMVTGHGKQPLIKNIAVLISHLNISPPHGQPSQVGLCLSCMDSLQKWHMFNCAVMKRHESHDTSDTSLQESPLCTKEFETQMYKHYRRMAKVKEIYHNTPHAYLVRRNLFDTDWDLFCEKVHNVKCTTNGAFPQLETYLMSREKLSHIYCVKCQQLITNGKKGFETHMATHHGSDRVVLPCDICGNQFPERTEDAHSENYFTHWVSHFYLDICSECHIRFPSKRLLTAHRRAVHHDVATNDHAEIPNNEDRPWRCDHCDARFKMKAELARHKQIRTYPCHLCGKRLKNAGSRRSHINRHLGKKEYKCESCQKEFYTISAFKAHRIVHQTERNFICKICGKAFKKQKALLEHETIHTGEKPYQCSICGRKMRVKSNLYKHLKIHRRKADLAGSNDTSSSQVSSVPVSSQSSSSGSSTRSSKTKKLEVANEHRILKVHKEDKCKGRQLSEQKEPEEPVVKMS